MKNIEKQIEKLSQIIERMDQSVDKEMHKKKHTTEEYRRLSRITNDIGRIIQAVEILKSDL